MFPTSSHTSALVARAAKRVSIAVGCLALVIGGTLVATLALTPRTAPAPVELAAVSLDGSLFTKQASVLPPIASSATAKSNPASTRQSGMLLTPPPVTAAPAEQPARGPMFDSRPIRAGRTIRMLVTAYSPDSRSCGPFADGITASGYSVWTNAMHLVAADTRVLPFGSVITIPGYHDGKPVPVLDRGGKIKGNHIDLLFPTNEQAVAWGKKYVTITVWEYAD